MDIELVAVVVTLNRLSLLQESLGCLIKALRCLPGGAAIVVVDVGSTDGSRQWLTTLATADNGLALDVVTRDGDKRYTAAVNHGTTLGLRKYGSAKSLLILDDDNFLMSPKPVLLGEQVLTMFPAVGALGFTGRKFSGEKTGCSQGFPTVCGFLAGARLSRFFGLEKAQHKEIRLAEGELVTTWDIIYSCGLLVRRDVWEASNGFDEVNFELLGGDVDWSWRVKKSGWDVGIVSTEDLIHDNRDCLSVPTKERMVEFQRSLLRMMCKHVGPWVKCLSPILWTRHLCEYILLLALAPVSEKYKRALAIERELLRTVLNGYVYS